MIKRSNITTQAPLRLIALMVISFLFVQFASVAHTHEAGHEGPEEHQLCSICLIAIDPDDFLDVEVSDNLDDGLSDLSANNTLIPQTCFLPEAFSSDLPQFLHTENDSTQKIEPYLASRAPPVPH